ncbi:MAG: nucleoside deaminase [Bacteroidaceae bacterium]
MKVSDIKPSVLVDCSSKLEELKVVQNEFMRIAIREAYDGISNGDGGPFGTAIVKDGVLVASGHNRVLANNDPTCHGEVDAIRRACQRLGTFDLSGCELFTTGEPCHMCLCACMWANISKIYYGCTIADNEIVGFRDNTFDQIFGGRDKLGDYMQELDREACLRLFEEYSKMNATKY